MILKTKENDGKTGYPSTLLLNPDINKDEYPSPKLPGRFLIPVLSGEILEMTVVYIGDWEGSTFIIIEDNNEYQDCYYNSGSSSFKAVTFYEEDEEKVTIRESLDMSEKSPTPDIPEEYLDIYTSGRLTELFLI